MKTYKGNIFYHCGNNCKHFLDTSTSEYFDGYCNKHKESLRYYDDYIAICRFRWYVKLRNWVNEFIK